MGRLAALGIALLGSMVWLLLSAVAAPAEKRVALVIGNSAYQNTGALPNPVNDSEDIAAALKKVGFTVLLEHNLDKRGMERAITRFARLAQDADAALFFYAGHGMQYQGNNYLMPIDAKLEDEFNLNFEMNRIDDVLFGLERARGVKVLILDACRNNPLADRLSRTAATRDLVPTRGLAKIEATRGMVIAYSTQANQVAVDGTGRNSPFTSALVKEMAEPGIEIGTLFRRVAAAVNRLTAGRQLPELAVSLIGDFYLNTRDTDLQAWSKIRDSAEAQKFSDFIGRYPNSPLIVDARERLAAVERAERASLESAQREQAERERLDNERARELEQRARLQKEQLAREQADRERLARENAERAERERLAREQVERGEREKLLLAAKSPADTGQTDPAASKKAEIAMLTPPAEPVLPTEVLSGRALVNAINKELKRVGCYSGRIDNQWASARTRSSVQKFVRHAKFAAPEQPAEKFLAAIRAMPGRVCPLECAPNQIEAGGRCVAKTCPGGAKPDAKAACPGSQKAILNRRAPEAKPSTGAPPKHESQETAASITNAAALETACREKRGRNPRAFPQTVAAQVAACIRSGGKF
jgi:uncharacterized caspase-like protein